MIYLHPGALRMLKTAKIKPDERVHDTHMVKRTIKERLFTLPWQPLLRYKPIYCPAAYIMADGTIVVSPKTLKILNSLK